MAVLAGGCSEDHPTDAAWTVEQARAVTTIRGMNVHVVRCRGLGESRTAGSERRYSRFACEAGTRPPGEAYDTVAIQYEIRVRERGHSLENVRFYGGPGIP